MGFTTNPEPTQYRNRELGETNDQILKKLVEFTLDDDTRGHA